MLYLSYRLLRPLVGVRTATCPFTSPLLDIMRQNVQLNSLSSTVTVAELNWCFPLFALPRACEGGSDRRHDTVP